MKKPSETLDAPAGTVGRLHGQVVVITGGGRGIGRAIALRCAAEGAGLVITSRTRNELDATTRAIRAEGVPVEPIIADVRDPADAERVFTAATQALGRVDCAVLNAGFRAPDATVENTSDRAWTESLDTNLSGVFYSMRSAIPRLRANRGGKIIVVSSAASRRAPKGLAAYAATAAGVNGLVRVAARELRRYDIAVNELQPGPTATSMSGVRRSDPDTLAHRHVVLDEGLANDESLAGEWFKSPSNVADLALFLATLPNHGPSGQVFSLNSVI